MDMTESVRIDKWLWAARFFKTRSLAQRAVRGGHVEINGHACKPARAVAVGDRLRITRGETVFEVAVEGLAERRGPASRAQALYAENEESAARRAQRAEEKRFSREAAPSGRPDKRERRRLRSWMGKNS